jgi:hypothetical protein
MINYVARSAERPRYYANDHSRDRLTLDPRLMIINDARATFPSLDVEGFALVKHHSAVEDFTDAKLVWDVHRAEIAAFVESISGADWVSVTAPGVLRFSEASTRAGSLNNSMPARFAHVDITDDTALAFGERTAPAGKRVARCAHYNVWRAISAPPQDVPLAMCDARTVAPGIGLAI